MKLIALVIFCSACLGQQVTFTYPGQFQKGVGRSCLLSWTPTYGIYTLRVGTGPGVGAQSYNVIYKSGITSNSYMVSLPSSQTIYAHVFSSTTPGSDVLFSTTDDAPQTSLVVPGFTNDIDAALWATAQVHLMRNTEGQPYPWTLLAQDTIPAHRFPDTPRCSDYAATLVDLLGQMGLSFSGHSPYVQYLAFRLGTRDTHTLVTAWNDAQQVWMILDPMFGWSLKRTLDGGYATQQDMNASVIAKQWSAITYVPLCDDSLHFAQTMALDYPLLWLQIPAIDYSSGAYQFATITNPVAPYLDASGSPKRYVF